MKVPVLTVNPARNFQNHLHFRTIPLELRTQDTTVPIPIHTTQDRYR